MMLHFIFLQNNVFKYPVYERYNTTDATIEILVMLFIAVLLGFLLRHFLGYSRKKEIIVSNNPGELDTQERMYSEAEMNAIVLESLNKFKVTLIDHIKHDPSSLGIDFSILTSDEDGTKKNKTNKTVASASNQNKKVVKSAKSPSKKETKVSDLKQIEGIGPAIEKLLNSHQIFTFSDLANKDLSVLDKILQDAGPRYRIHVPETWTKQAKLLSENKIEDFEKLTKELKAGRVKK